MINVSTSLTLNLHRVGEFESSKLFFGHDPMILGCDSYLLIIKSIADEELMFDGIFYDIDISII